MSLHLVTIPIATMDTTSIPSALFSIAGAIVGYGVSQWILFVTKRSEVLREKLEELWQSLLMVSRQTRPITAYGDELNEEIARNLHERAQLLIESLLMPTTFIALYFPQLNCRYSRITKACGDLAAVMRRPPITGSTNQTLAATYVKMMERPGFYKELTAASERAKAEIGDLQVYMREHQNSLIKTLKHALMDCIDKVSGQ